MMMGVMAMMVLAMPAAVYCTAINENPTPINGPENTAIIMANNPRCS